MSLLLHSLEEFLNTIHGTVDDTFDDAQRKTLKKLIIEQLTVLQTVPTQKYE